MGAKANVSSKVVERSEESGIRRVGWTGTEIETKGENESFGLGEVA